MSETFNLRVLSVSIRCQQRMAGNAPVCDGRVAQGNPPARGNPFLGEAACFLGLPSAVAFQFNCMGQKRNYILIGILKFIMLSHMFSGPMFISALFISSELSDYAL